MRRKLLGVIGCSQMSNPTAGTGSGGDRCTEAVGSMIDCSYRLGPAAKTIDKGADPVKVAEQVMYDLTRMLNNNSTVSHLENMGIWFPKWLHDHGYDKIISLSNKHNPSFADVKRVIDAGHIAIIGVNDYSQLKLADNHSDPYAWPENEHAGHVMLLVGYDENYNGKGYATVIVNDPLRADPKGMVCDYSFPSLQKAGFADLTEVVGKPFYIAGDKPNPTPGPQPKKDTLCVDVSKWQGSIDWNAYHKWSQQQSADGKSRVIMRASQDVATKDSEFEKNWSGAVAAGIDEIVVYHYAYPQDNKPEDEAAWFNKVVGSRLRPQDSYMLDFEENVPQATDAWVLAFRDEMKKLTGREIIAYENLNMIKTRMKNPELASIPLVLADWTYNPDDHPACPAPFKTMLYVQYSDKGSVPGISGNVDMDVFVGGTVATPKQPYTIQKDGSWLGSNGKSTWGWILDVARNALANPNDVNLFAKVFGLPTSSQVKTSDGFWRQDFENITVFVSQSDEKVFKFAPVGKQATLDAANNQIKLDQGAIANLNGTIKALNTQIDGLNHTVSSLTSEKAGLENQLAVEKAQITSLEDQINKLNQQLASKNGSDHEDVKKEMQDVINQLNFLPEVQKWISSLVDKL